MQLIITLVGLALLMIFFSLNTKNFLSQRNLLNIALQTSVAVLLAIAETFVIITGGIDLSIGSISAASGMIVAVCLNQGVSVPIAVSLGLLTGIALGAFNGFTVTVLGIVPFIATLVQQHYAWFNLCYIKWYTSFCLFCRRSFYMDRAR